MGHSWLWIGEFKKESKMANKIASKLLNKAK